MNQNQHASFIPDWIEAKEIAEVRSLSPQTLFHFTKAKESLFGILKNNFIPSFSTERIYGKTDNDVSAFGAPMVSFCDLRLSEVHDHIGKYGCYGIGMSKEWANANGLNTVYYISRHSHLVDAFSKAMKQLFEIQRAHDIQGLEDAYTELLNFNRFMKNYEGPLRRKDSYNPNYRFADEREWRYVPKIEDIGTFLASFAPIEVMEDPTRRENLNSMFAGRPLIFDPKDIRYLIIAREDERDELVRHISWVKEKYPSEEVQRLQTRILSTEQIHQDF